MSSLGQTLRAAREAKGLSLSKVAAETRILVQIIEDIENEDFHRIPAPIYGRGFVRLFAECVGLDPQPLVRDFMDVYSGRRPPAAAGKSPTPPKSVPPPAPVVSPAASPVPPPAPVIDPAPVEPPPAPESIPASASGSVPDSDSGSVPMDEVESLWGEPQPIPPPPITPFTDSSPDAPEAVPAAEPGAVPAAEPIEQPPVVRGLELFEQAPLRAASSLTPPPVAAPAPGAATSAPATAPAAPAESPFLPPHFETRGPSAAERFRSSLSSVSHGVLQSMRHIPRSAWRKSLLLLAALGLLALIVFGCIKLYQLTTPAPAPASGTSESAPTAQTAPAKAAPPAPAPKAAERKSAPARPISPPQAPAKLRSTGPKVPSLYVD